jgi:tetratricopeptide (TPR) repeat protein
MIRFLHHGYNLDMDKMIEKWKRSEALLLQAIGEDKSDTYSWRNLIRNYRAQRDYEKVISNSTNSTILLSMIEKEEVTISHTSLQMVWTDLAAAYHGIEDHEEAEQTFLILLDQYPKNIDGNFMLAELYRDTKQYEKAADYYVNYVRLLHEAKFSLVMDPIIVDTWGSDAKAYWAMAECYKATGEADKAWMSLRTFMLKKYEDHLDNCIDFARELELIGGESGNTIEAMTVISTDQGGMEIENVGL